MYCLCCTKTWQKSSLVYPGTNRIKKSVLVEHTRTQAHQRAIHLLAENESTAAVISHSSYNIDANKGLVNMFRVLGQEDIAVIKFDHLCSLIETCGGTVLPSYRNSHSGNEMLQCLADMHSNHLVSSLSNSPFFSILIDESTDVTSSKQLILYVRFLESSGSVTRFAFNSAIGRSQCFTYI